MVHSICKNYQCCKSCNIAYSVYKINAKHMRMFKLELYTRYPWPAILNVIVHSYLQHIPFRKEFKLFKHHTFSHALTIWSSVSFIIHTHMCICIHTFILEWRILLSIFSIWSLTRATIIRTKCCCSIERKKNVYVK